MGTNTHENLEKARRYSRALSRLFMVWMVFMIVVAIVGIPVFGFFHETTLDDGTVVRARDLAVTVRVMGAIGIIAGASILVKQAYHLHKLFALYALGDIFTAANVRQIRQVGFTFLLFAGLWVYFTIARIVSATAFDISGAADWLQDAAFVGEPFRNLVTGTIVMIASWIMDIGRELREEQDLTV